MAKLPNKVKINLGKILSNDLNDQVWDAICNYLSETYGYCFNGCDIERYDIVLNNIDWDKED